MFVFILTREQYFSKSSHLIQIKINVSKFKNQHTQSGKEIQTTLELYLKIPYWVSCEAPYCRFSSALVKIDLRHGSLVQQIMLLVTDLLDVLLSTLCLYIFSLFTD